MDTLAAWIATLPGLAGFSAFAWPWAFALLPLPWLAAHVLPARRDGGAALRVPFGERLDAVAAGGAGRAWRTGGGPLAWLAWACLCIAVARPQVLGEAVAPPQSGRDLMLLVDLSGSMEQRDMELGGNAVDRLTAVKAVLADFLERRVGDRVGLVVFGSRAYALTPLTLDRTTVREQLDATVAARLTGGATAIGDAIGLAVKRLHDQPPSQRVVILLTDGASNAGDLDPLKAAELARADHVRVHTIAFGNDDSGGLLALASAFMGVAGRPPESADPAMLRSIADRTGGRAFSARDTASLTEIYAILDKVEPVERPGAKVRPTEERYWVPLLPAMGLFLLAVLAGVRPRFARNATRTGAQANAKANPKASAQANARGPGKPA